MSWTTLGAHDIDLELEGTVILRWTCPRCDHRNVIQINAADLLHGTLDDLPCDNGAVCAGHNGWPQALITNVYLQVEARANGLTDVPLNK